MTISLRRAFTASPAGQPSPTTSHSARRALPSGRRAGDVLAAILRTAAANSGLAITLAMLAALCGLQALALLREGRAQAAADVYAGWQIDWASASDRCKAVRVAVLDAAGQHAAAEQMRSALGAADLRVEEKRLADEEHGRQQLARRLPPA